MTCPAYATCPTCSHAMASLGDTASREVLHCPRCGTLKVRVYIGVPQWHEHIVVPKLAEVVAKARLWYEGEVSK